MSKAHRGKGIRELFAHGRGTCPICGATGIKTLYEQEVGDQKIKICKPCRAAVKHGKKALPMVATPAPEAAAPVEAALAPAADPAPAVDAAETAASADAAAPAAE